MTKEEKLSYFTKEIELIQSEDIKLFLKTAIENMYDYVFIKPASSSGKHHSLSESGEGGLIRHMKSVFYLGYDILELEHLAPLFDLRKRDLVLVSLILHDCQKYGDEKDNRVHTIVEHPKLAAVWIEEDKIFEGILSLEDRKFIADCIASHSGQWNTNRKGEEILPKPITVYQQIVHLCDYLASRRYLNFDFSILETKVIEVVEPKDFIITFGKKHNGHTIQQIYETDASYLTWASENLKMEPARSYIQKFLKDKTL